MSGTRHVMKTTSPSPPDTRRKRFTFVMEQTLGHVSFTQNMQSALGADSEVDLAWEAVNTPQERWWEPWPLVRSNWSLRASLKARHAIGCEYRAAGRPDLYLFHTQVVSLLSSGWLRNSPPVVVSMDATPLNYDRVGRAYGHRVNPAAVERFKFWLNRRAFHHANFLVTWSNSARRSLIDDYGVPGELVEVIPPGTDLALWQEAPDGAEDEADDTKVRLLFVGGDFRRKGGELLWETFRRNFADGCELHLVSKSADVPEGGGVFVHRDVRPNSPELRALFQSADLFVLPTTGDVHSIAIIEAMAAGLPVVATDVGAISEVVRHEETGFLIPPGNEVALAQTLTQVVDSERLRRQLGERGRERAALSFDAERNAQQLLSICKWVSAGADPAARPPPVPYPCLPGPGSRQITAT